ncbi:MAG: rod shape-determining protein MreC [Acidobacteriia bacterium]|nr:rod shape-determining protein MreC [Terriglobia bacterium]
MIDFLIRQKNWTLLVTATLLQLALLGSQANGRDNVRLIQLWVNALIVPAEQVTFQIAHGLGNTWHRYVGLRQAAEENRRLTAQVQQLTLDKNRLEGEVESIRGLQGLLNLKEAVPTETVAAQVIGSSPTDAFKTVTINRGSHAGLGNNLPVITPNGVVGRLVRVYSRSAVVQLITDSESGVGVVFQNSRVHGVAKGTGGSRLAVDYVVNEEKITPGEEIRTSGEDRLYPKGLLVGHVVSVGSGRNIFKAIEAEPAVRFSQLEDVLVMKQQ